MSHESQRSGYDPTRDLEGTVEVYRRANEGHKQDELESLEMIQEAFPGVMITEGNLEIYRQLYRRQDY